MEMSHFVALNFMAHFCLLWYYFSSYFCKFLRVLKASCDYFPSEGKKIESLPHTFQKEKHISTEASLGFFCLFLGLINFEEFKAHVRTLGAS